MSYRMLEARKLIVSTQEKISVIANMVGYLHMNNFYTHFKTYFGVSPSAMRNSAAAQMPDSAITTQGGGYESLFNLDNPFIQFLARVGDMILANFLFIICSLPVVTIGAALTGLNKVTQEIAMDNSPSLLRSFFGAFKEKLPSGHRSVAPDPGFLPGDGL